MGRSWKHESVTIEFTTDYTGNHRTVGPDAYYTESRTFKGPHAQFKALQFYNECKLPITNASILFGARATIDTTQTPEQVQFQKDLSESPIAMFNGELID